MSHRTVLEINGCVHLDWEGPLPHVGDLVNVRDEIPLHLNGRFRVLAIEHEHTRGKRKLDPVKQISIIYLQRSTSG